MLYAQRGHSIEAVITGPFSQGLPVVSKVLESSSIQAFSNLDGALVISGKPHGLSVVQFGNSRIFVVDKQTALSFWNVRLSNDIGLHYDQSPDVPSILVFGPYLVRNATLGNFGTQLSIFGDLNATTTLEIVAPRTVKDVKWNGKSISVRKTDWGTFRGELVFDVEKPLLPSLRGSEWMCTDSLPEIRDNFDDTEWVLADKTETARPYQPYAGKVCSFTCTVLANYLHPHVVCLVRG